MPPIEYDWFEFDLDKWKPERLRRIMRFEKEAIRFSTGCFDLENIEYREWIRPRLTARFAFSAGSMRHMSACTMTLIIGKSCNAPIYPLFAMSVMGMMCPYLLSSLREILRPFGGLVPPLFVDQGSESDWTSCSWERSGILLQQTLSQRSQPRVSNRWCGTRKQDGWDLRLSGETAVYHMLKV